MLFSVHALAITDTTYRRI